MSFETISVVGLGYIGLPTAAAFASKQIKVIGVDVNQSTVDTINRGEIHIIEPELDNYVLRSVQSGYLRATTVPECADAFLIAVPTPFFPVKNQEEIPQPDLSYIEAAAKAIAPVLKKGNLVVLESTSPVGATEQMALWLQAARPDLVFAEQGRDNVDVYIAHCPERVLPGQVMRELRENDRVIGGITPACSHKALELYRIFVEGECVITNVRTAEMAKLTENASRDVGIAFANELSIICDDLGIDVWELISLANRHPRVNILQPGPGVGGHCIAVDPWFIVSKNPAQAKLIHQARLVNDSKPNWVMDKVKSVLLDVCTDNPHKNIQDLTLACLGLSFKANIDDIRESPALKITEILHQELACKLISVEPNLKIEHHKFSFEIVDLNTAIDLADVILLLVEHDEFKKIDPEVLKGKRCIDTKGIWF
ncbi:MAG: UDP-N-acetyl-D-mannosamine dehydrogenase [Gammaproteobacteria bacterium CG22_combo_CG10-13_8_21_14_all_40_8]|nr:MAG: UDP-N-acetyl-D-mannosamine dehydrogenase [Gammaproteobacteria bacterium CG22_combo_CG10-13_8_21_14_all_40_8]